MPSIFTGSSFTGYDLGAQFDPRLYFDASLQTCAPGDFNCAYLPPRSDQEACEADRKCNHYVKAIGDRDSGNLCTMDRLQNGQQFCGNLRDGYHRDMYDLFNNYI